MTDPTSYWRPAVTLGLIGLAAALLLAALDQMTRGRIDDQRREHALRAVSSMLEPDSYDNELLDDSVRLPIQGLPEPATVYRARLNGEPRAAVIDLTTPEGYSGDIRLLVAVDMEGAVLGVRILEHRETPGLGDRIERDKSDWVEQFRGKSITNPPPAAWAPDRRDGTFDTVTSATITSAAVIDAVKRALKAFESRTGLFETRADEHDPG